MELKKCWIGNFIFCLAVVFFHSAGFCFGGEIKGSVRAGKEFLKFYEESESSGDDVGVDYYWYIENGIIPVKRLYPEWSSDFLAVLTFASGGGSSEGKIYKMKISGADFDGSVVVIPPKSTVKILNEDPFIHNIYSPELGQVFAPEILSSGQYRQVQFRNPGVYRVKCKITPHLTGYVVVMKGIVATARIGPEGKFKFEDVPEGNYLVKIFYRGKVIGEEKVKLEGEKASPQVEIKVSPPGGMTERSDKKGTEQNLSSSIKEKKGEVRLEKKGK